MTNKSLTFIFQSHLFLTCSAFIFSLGILKEKPESYYFSSALALSVFGVYNLNRLNKLKNNHLTVESGFWYERKKIPLLYFSIFSLLLSASLYFILLRNNIFSFFILGLVGLITISYISSLKQLDVRQIPGSKAIWISIVWTCMAVIIPKLILKTFEGSDLHFIILFFALAIPGDIRDSKLDKPQMKTLPQLLGNQRAEKLFYLLIALFLMVNYYLIKISLFELVLVFLFTLIISIKRFHFRYELMDGVLFILGVCYLLS